MAGFQAQVYVDSLTCILLYMPPSGADQNGDRLKQECTLSNAADISPAELLESSFPRALRGPELMLA